MNMNLMSPKLFIVTNVDWFFLSHRLPIALAAMDAGYDVTILALNTGRKDEIESYGLRFIDIPFNRSGANPFHELKCIRKLTNMYLSEKPDIIHHVTLKASLLGCIAAKLAKNRHVVNAISGFGYIFTDNRKGFKARITKAVMKLAYKSQSFHYILQNPDDIKQFRAFGFAKDKHIHLIKGSGIDLSEFSFAPHNVRQAKSVRVILPARMLYDKGVIEFIKAAMKIKAKFIDKAEFILVGDCDSDNLAGIPKEYLLQMVDDPYIQWVGFQKDIVSVLQQSDIVVLPSYREGLPKSLIEACAIGRPIITTDTQGCRECVIDEYNGFLVPIKNVDLLAEKMEQLINDSEMRKRMGKNSRAIAEKEFSIDSVIEKHLSIYSQISYDL